MIMPRLRLRLQHGLPILVAVAGSLWTFASIAGGDARQSEPSKSSARDELIPQIHRNRPRDPVDNVYFAGKAVLPAPLDANAKGLREIYVEVFTPHQQGAKPYAWTKYMINKDAAGPFLDFMLTEKNLHFTSDDPQPNLAFAKIQVRLTRYGMMGVEAPGDIIGLADGVEQGNTKVTVTMSRTVPAASH